MRVFVVAWFSFATALLVSSRDLFTRIVFEEGDTATVSIQVLAAKDFELLIGNYSRVGFHHPGPAFIYVQALGEWLFRDVLHVVPSPWNGQAIAILLLNAALLTLVLSVVHDWYPSWTVIAGLGGTILLFLTAYRDLASGIWFPYVYFAPFLVLLVAASSVAAGHTRHLWMVALAGGLLIHGHAEFLFFVPLLGGATLYLLRRRKLEVAKRDWWLFAGIAAAFASTILLDAILHFPGELVKYVGYGGGHAMHAPWTAVSYTVQFWGPNRPLGALILLALFAAVTRLSRGDEFLRTGLAFCAATVPLICVYAMIGIDQIDESYIGYFSYAVPLFMFMLLLIGVTRRLDLSRATHLRYAAVALLIVGIAASGLTQSLANRRHEMTGIPAALDAMAQLAGPRPIVLQRHPHEAWSEVVPLVLTGARTGIRVCADDLELLVTPAYACTPTELATGAHFTLARKDTGTPPGQIIAEVSRERGEHQSWVTTPN
ncbi:hypothetical protein [Nocardia sp. NPDC004722]